MKSIVVKIALLLFIGLSVQAQYILIPMDEKQKNHLKAYGITYWVLQKEQEVDWLLNYRGGSFLTKFNKNIEFECTLRGVSYEVLATPKVNLLLQEMAHPETNMDVVKLEKTPKIVVYTPQNKLPWDDAVTLVLTYAEIPYDTIYDEGVLEGRLKDYDWLHLHHEDFTGQYGKFWMAFRNQAWYQEDVTKMEALAYRLGFKKVSQMKLAVSKRIKDYITGGGFLFAMCAATDAIDIALSADGLDIVESMFDGDPADRSAIQNIDFNKTLAFHNFAIDPNPHNPEFSNLDTSFTRPNDPTRDYFTLFDYSAKWDIVPTMLTQNHKKVIKGFMGLTTAFRKSMVKPDILILGDSKQYDEVRYLHGIYGKGQFSFLGGHDPEDYQHFVGDPPTDLNLHPNSAGYRLILNNVLFPAAKKKKQKT